MFIVNSCLAWCQQRFSYWRLWSYFKTFRLQSFCQSLKIDDIVHMKHTPHKERVSTKEFQNSAPNDTDSLVVIVSEGRHHRGPLPNKFSGHTGAVCGLKVCAIKCFLFFFKGWNLLTAVKRKYQTSLSVFVASKPVRVSRQRHLYGSNGTIWRNEDLFIKKIYISALYVKCYIYARL